MNNIEIKVGQYWEFKLKYRMKYNIWRVVAVRDGAVDIRLVGQRTLFKSIIFGQNDISLSPVSVSFTSLQCMYKLINL